MLFDTGQPLGLDDDKRARLAMALAGNSGPMAPIVQAMALKQQQAAKPQLVSPGTAANGGWSTSLVPTGGGGGLLSQLKSMFAGG
jgi:hypothetical protein